MPAATEPSSKRGTMTWSMTQLHATLEATVHEGEDGGAGDGDDEQPRVQPHHRRDHAGRPRGRGGTAAVRRADPRTCVLPAAPRAGRTVGQDVRAVGSVPAWTSSTSRCSCCGSCFGLFLAYHGYNKVFGGGRLAGHGTVVRVDRACAGRTSRPALAAATEIGAGLLFAVGLLTPLAAAGMIGVMFVAS